MQIHVHEKKEVSGKEQWADLEEEEEQDDMIEESVTESEDSADDDQKSMSLHHSTQLPVFIFKGT